MITVGYKKVNAESGVNNNGFILCWKKVVES